jgi:hypothetical protein
MVFDVSKKFLIFKKITFFVIFFEKNREKFKENPDRAGPAPVTTIDSRLRECSFLKELSVKEVPDLNKLIKKSDEEHQNSSKNKNDYKLPNPLIFFAENFQQHYSKLWKNSNIQIPFLPSLLPDIHQSTDVTLTLPNFIFKESNPLLPDVLRCFSLYIDIVLNNVLLFHWLLII